MEEIPFAGKPATPAPRGITAPLLGNDTHVPSVPACASFGSDVANHSCINFSLAAGWRRSIGFTV